MSNLAVSATTTPYSGVISTSGSSSSTTVSNTSSATTKTVTSSTTPSSSKTVNQTVSVATSSNTATLSSSTTYAYGNSASNSTSKMVSSTTVYATSSSTTPSVTSSSTTPNASVTHNIVYNGTSNSNINCLIAPSVELIQVSEKNSLTSNVVNTEYAYLSHMGAEAYEEIEDALITLGYDNNDDGEFIDSLTKFKNAYGMNSYNVYSSEVVDKLEDVYRESGLQEKTYVSKEKLEAIGYKNVTDEMVKTLNSVLDKYDITSQDEINHFLAQCFIESWYGKSVVEINWSEEVDDQKYFNEKYSGREDLGNIEGDDGYKYRGAGYIQLTGRYNYQNFAASMCDEDILNLGTEYVAENYAWEVSAWFWAENVHKLFEGGNKPSVSEVTFIINGGQNALAERQSAYDLIVAYDS